MRRDRLFWVVMAAIVAAAAVLILADGTGAPFGLSTDEFGRAAYLGIWAAVIGAALLGSRIAFGDLSRNLALWLLILLVLVAGYQYRFELQDIASRLTGGLVPAAAPVLPPPGPDDIEV